LDGKKHGKGKFTSADGEVYVGDWMNDKRRGNLPMPIEIV
jgi:hypothetical protein